MGSEDTIERLWNHYEKLVPPPREESGAYLSYLEQNRAPDIIRSNLEIAFKYLGTYVARSLRKLLHGCEADLVSDLMSEKRREQLEADLTERMRLVLRIKIAGLGYGNIFAEARNWPKGEDRETVLDRFYRELEDVEHLYPGYFLVAPLCMEEQFEWLVARLGKGLIAYCRGKAF